MSPAWLWRTARQGVNCQLVFLEVDELHTMYQRSKLHVLHFRAAVGSEINVRDFLPRAS